MKANNAFTLIEIMLVVIIIGIVLAMAAPNFSKGYSRFQLKSTADDLLSVSRWAQAMAIGQERIYALSFSSDHRSYKLMRVKSDDENDVQEDSFEPVNGTLGRMHTIPDTIRLDTQDERIEFYPDGTIDPATIQLDSPDQKTVLSSTEVLGMMTKVNDE
jgi:prepilin-type N-terminal cleavage/methylation domain-containing protein